MESQKLLKSCIVPFGFASFQLHAASHLDRVTAEWDLLLVQLRTYLGKIMSEGVQEPLPCFGAFPTTGWGTGLCDVPTVLADTTPLSASCCLQMLNKNETVSTWARMG